MDRREFLKTSGVAATAASASGATAAIAATPTAATSQQPAQRAPTPFVLAVPQSLAHIEVMTAAHRLAARLQTLFAGHRVVSVETTVESGMEAVLTARADSYLGLESQHTSYHPAFALISSLPLGAALDPMLHQAWLTHGDGRDQWAALAQEHGTIAFPAFHTGASAGLYSDKLLGAAEDLHGGRIAARGLAAAALKLLGADVVTIADTDLKGAITAQNLLAAEPLMAPTTAVAHWAFAPGMSPSGHLLSLGLRHSTWERLSPSERIGVTGIAAETALHSYGAAQLLAASADRIAAWRRWPVVTSMSTTLHRDLSAAGIAAVDALASTDATARRLATSLEAFRKGVTSGPWPAAPAMV